MRTDSQRKLWRHWTSTATVGLFAGVVAALSYAQQGAEPGKATPPPPDRATWTTLDCVTSGCHGGTPEEKFVHAPVAAKECDSCHEAVDEDAHKYKLVSEESKLCVDCHDAVGESLEEDGSSRSRHHPAAAGECTSCHDPHGSVVARLLKEAYPSDPYGAFDEKRYELCFECHEAELVTEQQTSEATEFRNGTANLHYLHVAKNAKGRGCNLCHMPHASTQDRLVRTSVKFNGWDMPIQFKVTETGGYCGPACHSAKRYDRINPVDWSVAPEVPK